MLFLFPIIILKYSIKDVALVWQKKYRGGMHMSTIGKVWLLKSFKGPKVMSFTLCSSYDYRKDVVFDFL